MPTRYYGINANRQGGINTYRQGGAVSPAARRDGSRVVLRARRADLDQRACPGAALDGEDTAE